MTGLPAADAVVVCRREQWAEAATVLSCFAPGALPPLLVLDPAPCSEADYARLHDAYRQMRERRDADRGTPAARAAAGGADEPDEWSNAEIDRRAALLTPFRRWIRRKRLLGEGLRRLPLRRAIFLCAPSAEEMSLVEAVPVGRFDPRRRRPLLVEGLAALQLSTQGDAPFWQRAWEAVRPGEPLPAGTIVVAADPIAVVAALYRSRRLGQPLSVGAAPAEPQTFASEEPGSEPPGECVVVEARGLADDLLAALYAARQGARLCVIPILDAGAIEKARQAVQAALDRQRDATPALATLRATVAAAVPAAVIDAVGDLPLTAFTAGVPYHLLANGRIDWADKPIGLMTGDPLLLCSAELFSLAAADDDGARIDVLFEPGYFDTRETEAVLAALRGAGAHCLLLEGKAASNTSLIAVPGLPLDLLFFDTHGSAESMLLEDMPIESFKLLQRVSLASRPLVFNNSCLSWTGVGREFIAVGARGYVGTLWSVRADQGARLAATLMTRIAGGEQTVAASLRRSGVDALTDAAYVFVGPVGARLAAPAPGGDERRRLTRLATALLQAACFVARQGPDPASPRIAPLLQALRPQAEALIAEVQRRWREADGSTLGLLTDQLDLVQALRLDPANAGRDAALVRRGLELSGAIESASPPPAVDLEAQARFWRMAAQDWGRRGRWGDAAGLLTMAITRSKSAGRAAGAECLQLADAWRRLGNLEAALQTAAEARAEFAAAAGPDAREGAMLAAGRLAQLWREAGSWEEARLAAEDGLGLAIETDQLAEQAAFHADLSNIARSRGDPVAAIACAERALATARSAHSENAEAAALGALARALIADRQWPRAREVALDGLRAAQRRGLAASTVAFGADLCDIAAGEGDLPGALRRLQESGPALAISGSPATICQILMKGRSLLDRIDTWDGERRLLDLVATVLPAQPGEHRIAASSGAIDSLMARIAAQGWAGSRESLWQIRRDLEQKVRSRGAAAAEQLLLLRDVVAVCHERASGRDALAASQAATVDASTGKAFALAAFVLPGDTSAHPAWRESGPRKGP